MIEAIIMAGGRSERMRAHGDGRHKALARLRGVCLVDHTVDHLLSHGFRDLAIAVNEEETALREHLSSTTEPRIRGSRGRLECVVETRRLGTIGAVRELEQPAAALLVVNVDNITKLDLQRFVTAHRERRADMSIASHLEPIRSSLGELQIVDGLVQAYHEKPLRVTPVSSGSYVLSPKVIELVRRGEPLGAPELFERARRAMYRVAAFEHDSPWFDVNDEGELRRAEAGRA